MDSKLAELEQKYAEALAIYNAATTPQDISKAYADLLRAKQDVAGYKQPGVAMSPQWNGSLYDWYQGANEATPSTAQCAHNWATYDSGFTKFEYCSKCDVKKD